MEGEARKGRMPADWAQALAPVMASPEMNELRTFLRERRDAGAQTCPMPHEWFSAFAATSLDSVRFVIVGQEPWSVPGMSTGMAFSVKRGSRMPPTLYNIHKEVCRDTRIPLPVHGNLEAWAARGVLLLNSVLTVEQNAQSSHREKGWEMLTDAALAAVLARPKPCVLMLWGKEAQAKAATMSMDSTRHSVLETSHPAPYSARSGFLGCSHFSKAGDFILAKEGTHMDWSIPP